MTRVKQNS